jgi:hypothetical protein
MKQKICSIIMVLTFMHSVNCFAGVDPNKLRKNIVGTWKFANYWNPYANDDSSKPSADDYLKYTAYTFQEDGFVIVRSIDADKNKIGTQKLTWGIVNVKDGKGKDHVAVRIVDGSIDPKDEKAIEQSSSGVSYLIIKSTDKSLFWIKINPIKGANSRDWQQFFEKVKDIPAWE